MKRLSFILAISVALAADSGYNLFQKGLARERADADPRGAIKIYEQVVRENAKDRKLAAQALVRIAECYAKLGDLQSRQVYERIVRDYSDQADAVTTARARLGTSAAITSRRILSRPGSWGIGRPAHDGRFAPCSDFSGGMLQCDLKSGEVRPFPAVPKTENVFNSVTSPDGRWIAYAGLPDGGIEGLRIVPADGSAPPRTLLSTQGGSDVSWIIPLAFTPDEKEVLVTFNRNATTAYHLGFVSITHGGLRVLKEFPYGSSRSADVSRDGRWVAFTMHSSSNSRAQDIYLIHPNGTAEHKVVDNAANDVEPLFTPDGRGLLFRSNRRGPSDIWFLPLRDGQPSGPPTLIKTDVDEPIVGVTAAGAVLSATRNVVADVFRQSFHSETGVPLAPAKKIPLEYQGAKSIARLSEDGQSLIYTRATSGRFGINSVVAHNLATGSEREYTPNIGQMNRFRSGHDGRYLILVGRTVKENWAQYRLDLSTGQSTHLFDHFPIAGDELNFTPGTPSRDGRTLYLQSWGSRGGGLHAYDLETRSARTILAPNGPDLSPPVLSRNGKQLGVVATKRSPRAHSVLIVNIADGSVQDLGPINRDSFPIGWTRDGKYLVIRTIKDGDPKTVQTWRYPSAGGPPVKSDVGSVAGIGPIFNFHAPPDDPDQVAWVTPRTNTNLEIWETVNAIPRP